MTRGRLSTCGGLVTRLQRRLATGAQDSILPHIAWGAIAALWALGALGQTPASTYQRAAAHLQNGETAAAIGLLEGALQQAPRDVKALTLLGMALGAAGRSEDALRRFEEALAIDPRFAPALKQLALSEVAAGRAAVARKHFEELLTLTPDDPVARLGLATAAIELKDRVRAAELLRLVPEAAPPEVHFETGVLWARLGEYAAAVPHFQKARVGLAKPYLAGFNLALAYLKNGQPADAARTAEDLIGGGHQTAEMHNLLGQAYEQSGRTKDAYEALRTATRIDPADESNYLDLVALCIKHGNLDLAREIAGIGVTRLPRSSRLHLQRGVVFAVRGEFEQAREAFESTLALSPGASLAHVALGLVLMQMDRVPEAVQALRGRVRAGADDHLARWFLAEALYRSGASPGSPEEAEAVRVLEKSVELKPDLGDARALLGKLLFRRGDLDRAAEHLEQALKLEPGNVAAMYPLAQVYSKKGEAGRARELFARIGKARQEERERFTRSGLAQIVREGQR